MQETESRLTGDGFFNGRIKITQDRSGYRFSLDAVLVAHFAVPGEGDRILDLGSGCGIIPLILAFRYPGVCIFGVEIQEPLAQIAGGNVLENGMTGRIEILPMDMRILDTRVTGGPVDFVVTNPPYRKARSGRVNSHHQRAVARHEISVTLEGVVDAGWRMLKPRGRFVAVVPAERMTDLLSQMRARGLEPKRLQMVHSRIDSEAKLVLVEGIKGGRRGVCVESPLLLYGSDGRYTDAVFRMFAP